MSITEWIERLSVKHPAFGNLPACPYARNAIYKVFHNNPIKVIDEWDDSFEIAIVLMENMDSHDLKTFALRLSDEDFLVLEDHPSEVEKVGDVHLNYGEPLLLITRREKIEKARAKLKVTTYYDHFSKEDYEDLMSR